MKIKKLAIMPYAQAHVEIMDNNSIMLFSYVTRVAEIDEDGWLTVYGLYSATTRRHISAFMREYTKLDYSIAKQCYNDKKIINIYTGEVRDI